MKTTFILALLTAFLTVSTASFAANCGAIDNTNRIGQEQPLQAVSSDSDTKKVETFGEKK